MEIRASNTPLIDWSGDGLAIGLFEEGLDLSGNLADLNKKLAGVIKELIEDEDFKGKSNSTAFTRLSSGDSIRKVILVGLGKADSFDAESLRRAAASAGKLAKKQKCKTLGISLPVLNDDTAQTAQAIDKVLIVSLQQ
ncbi:MAG: M17 family peptidase N-terminal domain-containing protein, partial [Cyanobacteria bacterium J06636_27]